MLGNHSVKVEGKRLLLFEFLIVLLVISFLVFMGSKYYKKTINNSNETSALLHFNNFSQAMTKIHALGGASPNGYFQLESVTFYFNENGWPANTERRLSPSLRNQTAQECQQLWESVFNVAPSSLVDGDLYKEKVKYRISLNKNVICRYQFEGKQEGAYFLDYDVSSGMTYVISD